MHRDEGKETAMKALEAPLSLPFLGPISASLGLVPLPPSLLVLSLAVVLAYAGTTELCKRWIWRG